MTNETGTHKLIAAKSQGAGLTLTLLFGPLGLLYASVTWGLILFGIAFLVGLFTFGIGALLAWPVSILLSFILINGQNEQYVTQHNQNVEQANHNVAQANYAAEYVEYQHKLAVWQAETIAAAHNGNNGGTR